MNTGKEKIQHLPYQLMNSDNSMLVWQHYFCWWVDLNVHIMNNLIFFQALRCDFRQPRDTLLNVVAEFLTTCSLRLADINKKSGQESKHSDLLDTKSHLVSSFSLKVVNISF